MLPYGKYFKGGNYAYACARVKAKKSLLLTKDNYPKFLMMDLSEISRFLGETQYRLEMTELASRYEGVNLIEMATSRNLARVYGEILAFSKGELREMLAAHLSRWDIYNVKTILRGKYYGASVEDIKEDLVPAGDLTEEDLNGLIALAGVAEVLQAVKKKKDIEIPPEVISAYDSQGALSPVEDYLDKLYYTRLLAIVVGRTKAERSFRAFVRKQIDHVNGLTLLRLKKEGFAPDKLGVYLIDGGYEVPMRELLRLAAIDSFDQFLGEMANFSFYEDIKEELSKVKETNSLNDVALAMQRHLLREAEAFSHEHPLSVLPIVDYMIRKRIEVDNIRIIARGKESGLDADQIKKLLVI